MDGWADERTDGRPVGRLWLAESWILAGGRCSGPLKTHTKAGARWRTATTQTMPTITASGGKQTMPTTTASRLLPPTWSSCWPSLLLLPLQLFLWHINSPQRPSRRNSSLGRLLLHHSAPPFQFNSWPAGRLSMDVHRLAWNLRKLGLATPGQVSSMETVTSAHLPLP